MKRKSKKLQCEEGLDPKIDVVFKTLFGKKGNEILIEDMLSGFLNQKIKCKNVLREARVGQLRANGKYGSLDVLVELEDGTEVDVDIQMGKQKGLPERMMAYASYLTSERLEKADRYSEINQKIIMFLVDFNMYPEFEGPVHETITVFRENTTKEFSKMHKYYVVELNKMDKTKCSEGTYKWLAFLNQNKEVLKEMSKDKCIQKAEDELKILAGDWETRRIAILRKRYILEMGTAEYAGYERGIEKGEATGEKRGIKKGTKQGIEKNKYSTATKMLSKNFSVDMIIDITGLSKKRILKLKEELCKKSLDKVH